MGNDSVTRDSLLVTRKDCVVRPATRRDIPTMVKLGQAFLNETILDSIVDYDGDAVAVLIETLIDSPDGHVTVLERNGVVVGGFIGILAPTWFNPRCKMAQQLCWYVTPEYRTRAAVPMLTGFRKWAQTAGAVWAATGFKLAEPRSMASLLARDGWLPLEEQWIRRL